MSPVIYFSATCYLLLLQCTSSAHTSPVLSLLCFLCKGISDPALTEAEKIREKSLQRGAARRGTLQRFKGCSVIDGDGKRCSGVDDLARNEPPSQVLALTSRCHMWLHVPYGV